MAVTGQFTANTISVTWQAHNAFQTAANDVQGIVTAVQESATQLATSGMADATGARFSNAVGLWCDQLNDIRNTLNQMTEQTAATANAMQNLQNSHIDEISALPAALLNF